MKQTYYMIGDGAVTTNELDTLSTGAPNEAPVSRAQLVALRTTFTELRERRKHLMDELRAAIGEIHTSREQLRRESRSRSSGNGAVGIAGRLQNEYGLTAREVEVARLLAQGLANSAVAQRLGISPHTARHHTQRVLVKLGVHSRAAAAARLHE
jgi:DNA-binding CsgD family transcriptional regulator